MIEGYITVTEIAKQWNLRPRTVPMMCSDGKTEGATKVGNVWVIPDSAEKPIDARIKSGRYTKKKLEANDEENH